MLFVYYTATALSILLMVFGLVRAVKLRAETGFDKIKQSLGLLIVLIVFFLAGYLVAPLVPKLGPRVGLILMAMVFFFGAVYVVLVLGLIGRLNQAVQEMLDYHKKVEERAAAETAALMAQLTDAGLDAELPEAPLSRDE